MVKKIAPFQIEFQIKLLSKKEKLRGQQDLLLILTIVSHRMPGV